MCSPTPFSFDALLCWFSLVRFFPRCRSCKFFTFFVHFGVNFLRDRCALLSPVTYFTVWGWCTMSCCVISLFTVCFVLQSMIAKLLSPDDSAFMFSKAWLCWGFSTAWCTQPWVEDGFQSWCGQYIIWLTSKSKLVWPIMIKGQNVGVAKATPAVRHSLPMHTACRDNAHGCYAARHMHEPAKTHNTPEPNL